MHTVILQRRLRAARARRRRARRGSAASDRNVSGQSILVSRPAESVSASPGPSFARPDAAELLRRFYLGRPPLTISAYRGDLRAFAAFAGAPTVETAVGRFLVLPKLAADAAAQEWATAMTGAPASRARRLATLRSLVSFARELDIVDWELRVRAPKVQAYRDTRGPGIEALRRMLHVVDELPEEKRSRAGVVLLLVGTLGLRRAEVARLRVGNVDLDGGRVLVRGKGGKEVFLTLPDITKRAIEAWIARLHRREPSDFLIQRLTEDGVLDPLARGVSGIAIYKIIAELGRRAGVRAWPHGLRHTAVTEVTRAHGLVAASQFARHSDVKTTMIYQDNLEDLAGRGAATLADLLRESE